MSVVADITSPEASNMFPNPYVQAILHILCQNLIDSGEKSAAELHEEPDDAIVMHFAQQDTLIRKHTHRVRMGEKMDFMVGMKV